MDPVRFDTLVKSLPTAGTRRSLLRLLAAMPVASGLLTLLEEASIAGNGHLGHKGGRGGKGKGGKGKSRHGRKGKSGRNSSTVGPLAPRCTPDCGGKACADDGCGGTCGCPSGQQCLPNGTCVTDCAADPIVCTSGCLGCTQAITDEHFCITFFVTPIPTCTDITQCDIGQFCDSSGNCASVCNP